MTYSAFPGWLSTFPTDILLDSGALYLGANGSGVLLGRSRGGLTFDPGKITAHVDFDGKRADVMGLHHITSYEAMIKGKILNFGSSEYVNYEPGITSASGSGIVSTVYTMQEASELYVAGDYLSNVRLIFRRSDLSFWQVRFPYAICRKYSLVSKDKDAAEIDVEFAAVLNLTVTNPFTGNQYTTDDAPYGFEAIYANSTL